MKTDEQKNLILTKAEMQVMNVLWDMENGSTVAAIIERYPDPKPAYTTVATFLTILEKKGFVTHRKSGVGKQHLYLPLISREEYTARAMADVKDSLFGGSVKRLVSFFVREEMLSREDVEELFSLIQNEEEPC